MRKIPVWERRFATVLFSDMCDSSRMAEHMEVEEFALLIESFREAARQAIPRHGGLIARLQGDGLLALFGFPQAHEDGGRRAAEAALDMQEALSHLGAKVRIHSGIHAGLLLAWEGDIERGRIDIAGEVPNTAARLCSLAGPGEIFVSDESLGPYARYFDCVDARRTSIRGRMDPITVQVVAGRKSPGRRIDASAQRGTVPFVGRTDELRQLGTWLGRGHGAETVIHVVGEPGVGKTRLLDEVTSGLDAMEYCVLIGGCESYLGAEPLQPFVQCLRKRVVDAIGDASDVAAADLAALLSRGAYALTPRRRTAAVIHGIRHVAKGRCPVVVLDDWQWADDASRQVLQSVVAELRPLRVILAERSTESEPDPSLVGAARLELQPLDMPSTREAIAAWLPQSDPFMVHRIALASGGSPLFIEELCHEAASGSIAHGDSEERGTAWLSSLVASRLARMPPALVTALQAAAVIGMTVPDRLLDNVNGQGSAASLRAEGFGRGMLVDGGESAQMQFRHSLTRSAVYATVDLELRRTLHLRAAQWLEATAAGDIEPMPVEALAYHYQQAGRDEQARRFAETAGDRALAAMALDRARVHYIAALRTLKQQPRLSRAMALAWCSLAERLGQTCVFDPLDASIGFEYFERAVRLAEDAGDINALARAEYWVAYVNYGRGRPRQAVRASESALRHAQDSADAKLVAQVKATLGQSLASAGQSHRALAILKDAVLSKREQSRPGSGVAIGSAYSLGRVGYTLGDLGRFSEAAEHFDQALQLLGGAVHSVGASVRELMCAVHLWQGRWEAAYRIGLEGADLAFRCRSRYLTAMGQALAHCGAWALRRDEASLRALHDATSWIERRGGAVSTSLNYGWLVHANQCIGDRPMMRRHAARLMQRARLQDTHGLAHGCRALARDAWQRQHPELAARYLQLADRAGHGREAVRELAVNQIAWAELAIARGDAGRGRVLAGDAAARLDALDMRWHAAQARALSPAG